MAPKDNNVCEKHDVGVRPLTPLHEYQCVRIQDQTSKLWDCSGVITEVVRHCEYRVRLDGSSRPSLCNRRHFRGIPVQNSSTEAPVGAPTPGSEVPAQQEPERRTEDMISPLKTNHQQPMYLKDYLCN